MLINLISIWIDNGQNKMCSCQGAWIKVYQNTKLTFIPEIVVIYIKKWHLWFYGYTDINFCTENKNKLH